MTGPEVVTLIQGMTSHPQHAYFESLPNLTDTDFEPLARRLQGYRQVSDAILLAIAKHNSAKLVTFDRAIQSLCPWQDLVTVISP